MRGVKGQVGFYIVFLLMAFVIIMIGAFAAPIGARFSTEFFTVGVNLLNDTRYNPVSDISDPAIKAELESVFDTAIASGQTNIEVSTNLFQYSWVFLLILVAIVLFILTKESVPFERRVA